MKTKTKLVPIWQRIQRHLDAQGKNAAWLAKEIGVSRSTITRILKGERDPQGETPDLFVDGTTVGKRIIKSPLTKAETKETSTDGSGAIQAIRVGRCEVGLTVRQENGNMIRDGSHYGDVTLTAHVTGSRSNISDQLRSLADHISGTEGDDMKRAFIVVLMSR